MAPETLSFSIVITTYNRLELLKRAIATALDQTIPCQVIVVDNASTDGTQSYVEGLIKELKELGDRLIYHRNPTNTNHSGAVNAGVDLATGSWIKLVADDDYLAPTCIAPMTRALSSIPKRSFVPVRLPR